MNPHWVKARAELFELLEVHPDWTKAQLAQATGMSVAWVKKWRHRRGVALKELGLVPPPASSTAATTPTVPAPPAGDPPPADLSPGGEPKVDQGSGPDPALVRAALAKLIWGRPLFWLHPSSELNLE